MIAKKCGVPHAQPCFRLPTKIINMTVCAQYPPQSGGSRLRTLSFHPFLKELGSDGEDLDDAEALTARSTAMGSARVSISFIVWFSAFPHHELPVALFAPFALARALEIKVVGIWVGARFDYSPSLSPLAGVGSKTEKSPIAKATLTRRVLD